MILKIAMPIDTYADSDIWTHTNACDQFLAESINYSFVKSYISNLLLLRQFKKIYIFFI